MKTCGNCYWWQQIYEESEGLQLAPKEVYGTCGWYDPQIKLPNAYGPHKIHRDNTHCPCHLLKKV